MKSRITSNARWSKIDRSEDTHNTVGEANGVCRRLLEDYGTNSPCPHRGVCLEAWVEVDGRKLINRALDKPRYVLFDKSAADFVCEALGIKGYDPKDIVYINKKKVITKKDGILKLIEATEETI